MVITVEQLSRFWCFVNRSESPEGCWEWIGAKDKDGYGYAWMFNATLKPHRLAYYIYTGHDPGDMLVCHSCDNPSCVKYEHLFLGTQRDNIRDAIAKGRFNPPPLPHYSGSKNPQSKLREGEVLLIRKLYDAGIRPAVIHKMFKVSQDNIEMICLRKTWKHI